jgi:hypothetical protein
MLLVSLNPWDRRESLQSAREWIAIAAGRTVPVTADTVHGIIEQLSQSGVLE